MVTPFIEVEDTEDPNSLPPPPVTDQVIPAGPPVTKEELVRNRYAHLLPHGTTISAKWDEDWIARVAEAEKSRGYAICGAKKSTRDMSLEDIENAEPLSLVCQKRAGSDTDHPGEGRCIHHGGNSHLGTMTTGQFSMIKNHKLASRVQEFYGNEKMMDITTAIATTYAAADAMMENEDEITPALADKLAGMMTRIANMVKQHNDIQEKRRISIEVPEFMAWVDFYYELAIKHITDAGGDPAKFLRDAQQFYDRTITIVVGPDQRGDSAGAGGQVSALPAEGVPRS